MPVQLNEVLAIKACDSILNRERALLVRLDPPRPHSGAQHWVCLAAGLPDTCRGHVLICNSMERLQPSFARLKTLGRKL